jgi:hypothetical protein
MSANIKLNGAADHSGLVVAESPQDSPVESSFAALLKKLSGGIRKEDIKQREGWKERNGRVHYVDYVEWHGAPIFTVSPGNERGKEPSQA